MDVARLSGVLADLLAGTRLDTRYYGYYESCRDRPGASAITTGDAAAALARTPWPFAYDRSEGFFGYREQHGPVELGLNVSLKYAELDPILVLAVGGRHAGGPFTRLAREVAQRRDPGFEPSPRAPRVRVRDTAELADAVRFTTELYGDVRAAVLGFPGWAALAASG